jgi:hypothetical protein
MLVNSRPEKKNKYYTNLDANDNNLQLFKLFLSKYSNYIDKNWLKIEIMGLLNYGIGQTNIFKLLDQQNNEVCICQFIQKYNINGNLIHTFNMMKIAFIIVKYLER